MKITADDEKISHGISCNKVLTESEKYRGIQGESYKLDFDNSLN